jgi:hypothetical protein
VILDNFAKYLNPFHRANGRLTIVQMFIMKQLEATRLQTELTELKQLAECPSMLLLLFKCQVISRALFLKVDEKLYSQMPSQGSPIPDLIKDDIFILDFFSSRSNELGEKIFSLIGSFLSSS